MGRGVWRNGVALAILAGLLGLFFWPVIRAGEDGAWSTADLTQSWALTRVDEGHRPANPLLSDPPFQMQPWFLLARGELLAGRLPLWNPYNGAGQPLFANYQAALLSPFHLPLWMLGLPAGLPWAAALKLGALAALMYLLLRQWQLAFPAAVFGAIAFAFCGHNVLCLAYPHPGTLVALPGGMYFAERLFAAWRARQCHGPKAARLWPPWCGLALCFAVAALAGHPEPFFFAGLGTGALVLFRLCQMGLERRTDGIPRWRSPLPLFALASALLGAATVGTLLGAVQIVPFLEYLQHSAAIHTRGEFNHEPLLWRQWPLLAYPDLLGNPSGLFRPRLDVPHPNYEGANLLYPSAIALLLAGIGWCSRKAGGVAKALLLGLVLWIFYAYNLVGLADWAARIPVLSHAPLWRSQPLALFAVAALAAFAVDSLLDAARGRQAWIWCLGLAGLSAAFFWMFSRGALAWVHSMGDQVGSSAELSAHAREHMVYIHGTLALGTAAALAVPLARARVLRGVLCAALLASVFLQTGWLFREYNPTIERRHFFPTTASTDLLAKASRTGQILTLDGAHLPPEHNSAYGIRTLSHYDALGVGLTHNLLLGLFDLSPVGNHPRTASLKAMRLAGCTHVLHRANLARVDTEWGNTWNRSTRPPERLALTANRSFSQSWALSRSGARSIGVLLGIHPAALRGETTAVVEDLRSGRVLSEQRFLPEALIAALEAEPGYEGLHVGELLLVLPPPQSGGEPGSPRELRVTLSGSGGEGPEAAMCFYYPDLERANASAHIDGSAVSGCLRADVSYSAATFELVRELPGVKLSRYLEGLGRYYCVDQWRVFDTSEDLLDALAQRDFDPYANALLLAKDAPPSPPESAAPQPAHAAEVLSEHPGRVRLRVERDRPGLLVVAQSHFPGWRAEVNGKREPMRRTNHAWTSVAVPAGSSEIELRYAPGSLLLGAALSLFAVLAWAAAWACSLGRRSDKART